MQVYTPAVREAAPASRTTSGAPKLHPSAGDFGYVQINAINQIRGEKELPDSIRCAIDDGLAVKSFSIGEGDINIDTPEDAARRLRLAASNL